MDWRQVWVLYAFARCQLRFAPVHSDKSEQDYVLELESYLI